MIHSASITVTQVANIIISLEIDFTLINYEKWGSDVLTDGQLV